MLFRKCTQLYHTERRIIKSTTGVIIIIIIIIIIVHCSSTDEKVKLLEEKEQEKEKSASHGTKADKVVAEVEQLKMKMRSIELEKTSLQSTVSYSIVYSLLQPDLELCICYRSKLFLVYSIFKVVYVFQTRSICLNLGHFVSTQISLGQVKNTGHRSRLKHVDLG